MSSEFGKNLPVSVFGTSHGPCIGVKMLGVPKGEPIDLEELQRFLDRRRPGGTGLGTARNEADIPVFRSGIRNGRTDGQPIEAIIENTDVRSKDYRALQDLPRPSHADFAARLKWGDAVELSGGGHFSGRLTAPLCIAGGLAKQMLARRGITVAAHIREIGGIEDDPLPLFPDAELLNALARRSLPVLNEKIGQRMKECVERVRMQNDSVGGIVECAAIGIPGGIGEPMFDGMENHLAYALFGIPGVKGVSFGSGFLAAKMQGSEHNDPFTVLDGRIVTETNHSGGIQGGITNGMPIVLQVAFKPTPSIGLPQKTVRLSTMEPAMLEISGRHDPCIVPRAVPVVEAVTALVLMDRMMEEGLWN